MKDLPRVTALPRVPLPRATAINNRTGQLRSKTFLANDTFIVPAGVRRLEKVEGKGGAGTPGSFGPATLTLMNVATDAFPENGAVVDVDTAYGFFATYAANMFSGSGERTVSYDRTTYRVGTDETTVSTNTAQIVTITDGYANNFGDTGGNITQARAANIYYRVDVTRLSGNTPGASATGFGLTFPGGANGPASITKFEKVTVTPLTSYPIVVPAGGSITIWFF